ncbi:MAG: hypothetical protein LUC97_02240 [Clostridiales bacterium]|nr:hypothetical protein [Clostridiales bacterium]
MAAHTHSPEAQRRALAKYVKKTYDRIDLRMTKDSGLKAQISEHAEKTGESVNSFILRAIKEAIENDNKRQKNNGTFSDI